MKFVLLICLVISSFGQEKKLTHYVDPFIGTGGHGHTYPGASMPFGMVQLSPDTRIKGWDACSGYHYSDNTIMGFSHTHLSGTGAPDYGDTAKSAEVTQCAIFSEKARNRPFASVI